MLEQCPPDGRAAILSFHSHGDRSFLDDRELATLSGVLRERGIDNDLVLVVMTREAEEQDSDVERRLVETLRQYNPIVYERVWTVELIHRLRAKLPGNLFIGCRGEHVLHDPPADVICEGDLPRNLPVLIDFLRGKHWAPPVETLFPWSENRRDGGDPGGDAPKSSKVRWVKPDPFVLPPPRPHAYAPNLRPVVVNPESLPPSRTFSIKGNDGCPFQLDARENPLYAGTTIPAQYGKGCAFCTTGNKYVARPNPETAAWVLEQIRYVRANAPENELLVLKDQNPFGYLTEVVQSCADEGISPFTLLLETRGDWFLRNVKRFERALEVAKQIGLRLAPFLVGIENFSQPELDRFNKGTTAEANVEFIDTLWRWKDTYGDAMDLSHASFGFILFSPWTTLDDLRVNLDAIRRTRFDRFRGSLLLSRARLYPDTALYYLAQRDGLLADVFLNEGDDNSRRYGYYPSRPWRFQNADVERFSTLAQELAERNRYKDMINLFQSLLDAFAESGERYADLNADEIWARYQRANSAKPAVANGKPPAASGSGDLRRRFAQLVDPLPFEGTFAEGWRIGDLTASPGRLRVQLNHDREVPVVVELVPRGTGPHFERSRHYDMRYANNDMSPAQQEAVTAICQAIARNDR